MKALAWHGKGSMRCDTVPDPKIEHPRDAIIKVTACAILGSDLHIYDEIIPSMQHGDGWVMKRWARSSKSGSKAETEGRRQSRRSVHHFLWRMFLLQARIFSLAVNAPTPTGRWLRTAA